MAFTKSNRDVLLVFLGIGLIVVFFTNLFFPKPQLYFSPDGFRSDVLHFHYPVKDFLHKSLQQGHLPLWTDLIGTGFPLFAEGQIGALYPPNILLFGLLPTWFAFNLSYLFSTIICFQGIYLLLKFYKRTTFTSVLFALTFCLSGFFTTHFNHLTMIQTISWMPLIIYLVEKFIKQPTKILGALLSLAVASQILAGYFQMSFMTFILTGLLILYRSYQLKLEDKSEVFKKLVSIGLFVSIGIGLAAPQIVPTLELLQQSPRSESNQDLYLYTYPYKLLITWLRPYWFGSHSDASYSFSNNDRVFIWENTFYIGIAPLILFVWLLYKRKKKVDLFWLTIGVLFLLLGFGVKGPLLPLFSIPGFESFRVPSRYMVVTAFAIIVLSSQAFELLLKSSKDNKLVYLGAVLSFGELVWFGYTYNALIPVDTIVNPPEIVSVINKDSRVLTYPTHLQSWQNEFTTYGWQRPELYIWMKNGLAATSNLVWSQAQTDLYAGLFTRRQGATAQAMSQKVLDVTATEYIISPTPVHESLMLVGEATVASTLTDTQSYTVYRNPTVQPRFRMVYQVVPSKDENESYDIISQDDFIVAEMASIEGLSDFQNASGSAEIKVVSLSSTRQEFQVVTDNDGLFIVADSFYPGWVASINGQETIIYPTNGNQRGVVATKGENTILFEYKPKSFRNGTVIFLITLLLLGSLTMHKQLITNLRKLLL